MSLLQVLNDLFFTDVDVLANRISTTQPWFDAQEISTGFGPDTEVIEMGKFYSQGLVVFVAFDCYLA